MNLGTSIYVALIIKFNDCLRKNKQSKWGISQKVKNEDRYDVCINIMYE